ncbi:MAG: hypothetical protein V2A76_15075 [Planctomycetota bacterium]
MRLAWDRSGGVLFIDRDGDGDLSDEEPGKELWGSFGMWQCNDFQIHSPEGPAHGIWTV